MIHVDGKPTIVTRSVDPVRKADSKRRYYAEQRERRLAVLRDHRTVPAANGQEWNDDRCACGGEICDCPAGDKCWDCFNFDPSEGS